MCEQNLNSQISVLKTFILNCINDLKGKNVICLNINSRSHITNMMILCTGKSNRHVISITHHILDKSRKTGFQFYGIEGLKDGEWVLIDLGDIIVHIMQKKIRELYSLEKLWLEINSNEYF